jgi:hypothetical protein
MKKIKPFIIAYSILFVITIVCSVVIIVFPYKTEGTEATIGLIGIACFILNAIFLTLTLDGNLKNINTRSITGYIFFIFAIFVIMVPLKSRGDHADNLMKCFDAEVVRVYNSENHNIPAVELKSGDCYFTIEGINDDTWKIMKQGDMLQKDQWKCVGRLNGKRVLLFTPGPFDNIRGIKTTN